MSHSSFVLQIKSAAWWQTIKLDNISQRMSCCTQWFNHWLFLPGLESLSWCTKFTGYQHIKFVRLESNHNNFLTCAFQTLLYFRGRDDIFLELLGAGIKPTARAGQAFFYAWFLVHMLRYNSILLQKIFLIFNIFLISDPFPVLSGYY